MRLQIEDNQIHSIFKYQMGYPIEELPVNEQKLPGFIGEVMK